VAKRLGIVSDRYAKPLFDPLKEEKKFILQEGFPAELAIRLRHKELDGAFLSPIDFAKNYSSYRILPEIAAVSERDSGAVLLIFREDGRSIKKIGVNPAFESEIVLASVIFTEKYEIHPGIVPSRNGIACIDLNADAYLACGKEAQESGGYTNKIDLVDEWYDVTELPYVHGFWAIREGSLERGDIDMIIKAGKEGAGKGGGADSRGAGSGAGRFRYSLGEHEIYALNEFYRMAYYHGIIRDIPDLRFA